MLMRIVCCLPCVLGCRGPYINTHAFYAQHVNHWVHVRASKVAFADMRMDLFEVKVAHKTLDACIRIHARMSNYKHVYTCLYI